MSEGKGLMKNLALIALVLIVAVAAGTMIMGDDSGADVGNDGNGSVVNDTTVVENGTIEGNSTMYGADISGSSYGM